MAKETESTNFALHRQKSKLNLTIVVCGTLLLTLLIILYYQNQQLKQELNTLKSIPTNQITLLPSPVSSSTSNYPMASWVTYTDSLNNFSYQHPQNLSVYSKEQIQKDSTLLLAMIPVCDSTVSLACLTFPNTDYPNTNFSGAGFSVSLLPSKTTKQACNDLSDTVGNTQTLSEKTINNTAYSYGERGSAATGNQQSSQLYRTFHSGKCFELSINISTDSSDVNVLPIGTVKTLTNEQSDKIKSNLYQILSTFKFLTPTVSVPNTWKTYLNTKNHYSFKYPSDWRKGSVCEGDTQIDLVRFGPGLLEFPGSDCGTANIPSTIMVYVTPTYQPYSGGHVIEHMTLNNINGNYYIYKKTDSKEAGSDETFQAVIPLKNSDLLLVIVTGAYSINKGTFDAILSTFKFTN